MNDVATLFVGGTFDDKGGKASGFQRQLFEKLGKHFPFHTVMNGGFWNTLSTLLDRMKDNSVPFEYKVIFWFPDVSNLQVKLLETIKVIHPTCQLIISKRNLDGKYSSHALIARCLQVKANLLLDINGKQGVNFVSSVLDPLGNSFCEKEVNIDKVADALAKRIDYLLTITRIGSKQIGPALDIPKQDEFFQIVKDYAEVFHKLIHTADTTRFLGNLSFRCARGFPSMRGHMPNIIYVSERNVDKCHISSGHMVAVNREFEDTVGYYGNKKPSVDTPVQLLLYQYYDQINYMMHSHVYVKDAPFTEHKIPCGAMEEVADIRTVISDLSVKRFAVNLRGHGSIVASEDLEGLRNIPYIARDCPER